LDRNTVIATVLIGIIMLVWLYWLSPPPVPVEGIPASDRIDSSSTQPEISALEPRRPGREIAPIDSSLMAATDGEERLITVTTNVYTAVFSTRGATLHSLTLRDFTTFDRVTPVQLVDTTRGGAIGMVFTTPASHTIDTRRVFFESDFGGDRLDVMDEAASLAFDTRMGDGAIRFVYEFVPDNYEIRLRIEQQNPDAYSVRQGYDLVWDGGIPFSEENSENEGQRAGAFARSGGEVVDLTLQSDAYEEMSLRGAVDWVAVKSAYFTTVLMPDRTTLGAEMLGERTAEPADPDYSEYYEVSLRMPPAEGTDIYTLYLGPMEYPRLRRYGADLYGMVDYGYDIFEWMTRPLAKFVFIPVFRILSRVLPNYGVVIIILAILMKIVLYPLTKASFKNMARMRELQPKMEAIKEKYADNPQKQQEAMMKMYKETGVNPLGGCVPMLLQYPVIIALWQFLPQSIEIRQQGFLWAADLSAPDKILALPFNIPLYGDFVAGFTLLMGLSMVVQMKIQMASTPSNPQTKIFIYVMPVMIFAIFNRFASGLSLYYLCYNVFTAVQQKLINRSMDKAKEAGEDVAPVKSRRSKTAAGKPAGKKPGSKAGRRA
jgi:YidC/Oxa1 family membrane protein insertase